MRILLKIGVVSYLAIMIASCNKVEKKQKEEEVDITELPYQSIHLTSLDEFKSKDATTTWKIVGNVLIDHDERSPIEIVEGEGLLLNAENNKAEELLTNLEHGDIDVKIDFMTSKNTSAILYLQGRYGIQLMDSWKSDTLTSKLCGVILQGKDSVTIPLLNVSKAPGLWQHLLIKFKAPRFDTTGNKISNALFEEVILNGKTIQKGVEVAQVADGPFADERKQGPLRFVKNMGMIAFRNLQYKVYGDERIALRNLKYEVHKGLYKKYDTLKTLVPVRTGPADSLHWNLGDKRSQISFQGIIQVPQEGQYLFKVKAAGPAWLLIDDQEVVDNKGNFSRAYYGTTSLIKGDHQIKIIYANYFESLSIEYAGPGIPLTKLTVPSSERIGHAIEPMELVIKNEASVQRGFFTHHGKVNTYTMSVGIPGSVNYAYDLSTFNLLTIWRGRFIDVADMWTERGESQMEIPLGAPIELSGAPSLEQLSVPEDDWIDTVIVDNNMYTDRGYQLQKNGLPVFFYSFKGIQVKDYFSNSNAALTRTVTLNCEKDEKDIYFLLGTGKRIERLSGGGYAMDDKEYFIDSISGMNEKKIMIVQTKNGRFELLLPITVKAGQSLSFNYSIIW